MEQKVLEWISKLKTSDKPTYRIHGQDYKRETVIELLSRLDSEDIKRIANSVEAKKDTIRNQDAYICSCLVMTAQKKPPKKNVSYDSEAYKARARNIKPYQPLNKPTDKMTMAEWKERERYVRKYDKELEEAICTLLKHKS